MISADDDPEAELFLLQAGGQLMQVNEHDWTIKHQVNRYSATSGECACTLDSDGDGRSEILVASRNEARLYDDDLTNLWWHGATPGTNGSASCASFDFDADGRDEILWADGRTLWLLDPVDGSTHWQLAGQFVSEVAVADVDGDGSAEIVLGDAWLTSPSVPSGVIILGNPAWAPAARVWSSDMHDPLGMSEAGVPRFPARTSWAGAAHRRQAAPCECVASSPGSGADLPEVGVGEAPLRVDKAAAELVVSWGESEWPVNVLYGRFPTDAWGHARSLAQYTHEAFGACALAGQSAAIPTPPDSGYLLAVASACPAMEGPAGRDSLGRIRPSTQELGTSPCP